MKTHLRPLLSPMIIVTALLFVVFAKTEVRRLGYEVFRLTKSERSIQDDYRGEHMRFAQLIRPDRIENIAQTQLELKEAGRGQIIQLVAGRVALKH